MIRSSFKNVTPVVFRIFESEAGPRIWAEFRTERGDKLELEFGPEELTTLRQLGRRTRDLLELERTEKVTVVSVARRTPQEEAQERPQPIPLKPKRKSRPRLKKPLV